VKVAIYARYSSENQRDASIADQFRVCREFAQRQGWHVAAEFSDHAVSGATTMRPGFQAMMREALQKKFDIVMAAALDRFSRDQEDTAGLFKRPTFAGVNIVTLAEGDITHLHIGLKGTMNALFLKELAEKTRRGLRGRIELGKAGGGVSFGYRIVRRLENGLVTTGERDIVPEEAAIVRRIYNDYAAGASPKQIAKALNAEGVRGPRGALWSPSTIHGSAARGIGVLHDELYIGRLVWNRQRFLKDPDTGKRVPRMNSPSQWITKDVPELRIIDDDLWQAVKARHAGVQRKWKAAQDDRRFNQFRRPKYLFSGLTKCGECGAGFVVHSREFLSGVLSPVRRAAVRVASDGPLQPGRVASTRTAARGYGGTRAAARTYARRRAARVRTVDGKRAGRSHRVGRVVSVGHLLGQPRCHCL
jgi:DNA invertase Pin-like site-specific DNA recombinase